MIHSKQFISNLDDKCIQPNATDLRVSGVQQFTSEWFELSEEGTTHRDTYPVPRIQKGGQEFWTLNPGKYSFSTDHYVEIPEGVAGIIVHRSSLNRNGIIVTSGLWDSGFKGYVGGLIHVPEGCVFRLHVNARIGQFVTWQSQSEGTYAGGYNQEQK